MTVAAAIVFAIAAGFGLYYAYGHYKRRDLKVSQTIVHGGIAAVGLILLIIAVAQGATATLYIWALVIFIAAALGGILMLALHASRGARAVPFWLVLGHGSAAVIAFVLLLIALAG